MKKILTQFSGDLKTAAILGMVVFTVSVMHGFVVGFTTAKFVWALVGGMGSFLTMVVVNTLPSKAGVGAVAAIGLALYMMGSFDHFGTLDDAKAAVEHPASTVINSNTPAVQSETPVAELDEVPSQF